MIAAAIVVLAAAVAFHAVVSTRRGSFAESLMQAEHARFLAFDERERAERAMLVRASLARTTPEWVTLERAAAQSAQRLGGANGSSRAVTADEYEELRRLDFEGMGLDTDKVPLLAEGLSG